MQINHNINAMITQHALYNNNNAMGKSLEKLSTGLKINRAQDDAAGLAMSEQMRTQIRGLGKAKQNAQDGIAALQIAEGGLSEITNIIQRQRELAVQASNDTLTSTERAYLNLEFQELSKEVGRIALGTNYNGKNLLVHSDDPNLSFGAASGSFSTKYKNANSFTLHIGPNYTNGLGGKLNNEMATTYSTVRFANMPTSKSSDSEQLKSVVIGGVTFTNLAIGPNKLNGEDGSSLQPDIAGVIDSLDRAVKEISGTRAKIGTFINRLEYTVNNIASLEFNTQDAESRIRDTDFASATTDFTKNQILVQSATSMLAQANSLPQSALSLIQG
ncbi:flagellin [Fibrobacterales bacterium]|nr:flagellin [Fibrobacterales bacterium]